MSLTINDLADLRQLLIAHPEWRSELRPLILGEEIERPAGDRARSCRGTRRTEQRVAELAEAQRRTEQRMAELAEDRRTEQRMAELAEANPHERSGKRPWKSWLTNGKGDVVSSWVSPRSMRYRNTPGSFFGRWIKRPVVADLNDLRDLLEPHLTPDEVDDALLTDLVIKGNSLQPPRQEIWLVVEVSAVVDRHDIDRAVRRAGLFRRAGLAAVPVVAGETTTSGGNEAARDEAVAVLQDGQRFLWPEATAKWLASSCPDTSLLELYPTR